MKIELKKVWAEPSIQPINEPVAKPSTELTAKPIVASWTVMQHYLFALASLPESPPLPMAGRRRQRTESHRRRLCRWQSDTTVGKAPSAKNPSAKRSLPTTMCLAISFADGHVSHRQRRHVSRRAVRLMVALPTADVGQPSAKGFFIFLEFLCRWPRPSAYYFCRRPAIGKVMVTLSTACQPSAYLGIC
jgi:hypothetical protein